MHHNHQARRMTRRVVQRDSLGDFEGGAVDGNPVPGLWSADSFWDDADIFQVIDIQIKPHVLFNIHAFGALLAMYIAAKLPPRGESYQHRIWSQ